MELLKLLLVITVLYQTEFIQSLSAKSNNHFEIEKVKTKLKLLQQKSRNAVLIQSVNLANQENKSRGKLESLKKILELDKKWQNSVGVTELILPFLNNNCAKYLNKIKLELKFTAEIFVMDNLGAIVCETDKTSDFWQGDEAKWLKSYNDGKGKPYFGEPKFDESSQAFLIQISLPIKNNQGKTIGAITYGVDLDKI